MVEPKISLSLLVPGAIMLSSQECDKNPKESYDKHKMLVSHPKGKGKHQKMVKELLVFKTRKPRLVTQNINLCEEAYQFMLLTPTTPKLGRIWDTLSVHERLKKHFDLIAYDFHAVSYSYEILGD